MKKIKSVITGMGCLCAAGTNLEMSWKNMMAGVSRPCFPTKFQAGIKRKSPVFEVSIDKSKTAGLFELKKGERTSCNDFFLIALKEALDQAALSVGDLHGKGIGVCAGTTVGCTLNDELFYRKYRKGSEPGLGAIKRFLGNNPAQYISKTLNLKGPVSTINNACSSGADAVGQAMEWIEDGLCRIVIAAGVDELSRIPYLGFTSLLNTSEQPCRPFDVRRDGLNLGEGAGVLILESRANALERGADVLVEAVGYGTCTDAYHQTAPHPQGIGLETAIHQALANISPEEISFINAHGTATVSNDIVEGTTLSRLFGKKIPLFGTKSYTGHTLGAAGAIEAIFTAQGLITGKIPPTAGFSEPDTECMLTPTRQVTEVSRTYAISNSLAFGGNNSVLLLKAGKDVC